jgi:fermentation-respiration switch protein FrsA (DUF1100 family)
LLRKPVRSSVCGITILAFLLSFAFVHVSVTYAATDEGCGGVAANSINPIPKADLVIRQDQTYYPLSQKSIDVLATYTVSGQASDVIIPTGVADAIGKIQEKSNSLGRPIEVLIFGHGAPGLQQVGDQGTQVLTDNNDNVKEFTSQLRGKVSSVHFLGCSVGAGTTGSDFLQRIADGLGGGVVVDAYDDTVYPAGNAACNFNGNTKFCTPGSLVRKVGQGPEPIPEFGVDLLLVVAMSVIAISVLRRRSLKPILA